MAAPGSWLRFGIGALLAVETLRLQASGGGSSIIAALLAAAFLILAACYFAFRF